MTRQPDSDHRPAHILVVDDSPASRYVLATVLRRGGHEVTEAEDGTSALELLRRPGLLPEIAIVDVRLPDMTGFEVCEHIKNDPATAGVPVINISAYAITVGDRAQGLYRGADTYLVDPVAPEVLLATVTATLRYTRARRRAELLADRLRLLNGLTLAMYSASDAHELLRVTTEGAAAIFRCAVAAFLTTPEGNPLVGHTWQDPEGTARPGGPQVHSAPAWPQRRDPAGPRGAAPDGPGLPCLPPVLKDPAQRRTVVGRAKPERPPVVIVTSRDAVTTPDDEQLLAQLTQASALALEALRSYSEEHALALTLQRSFLPERLPETERAELAVRYLPASERTEIGGDFYEAISTPAGLVVAVGDVAGHSLDAAMVMGQVRHALRAYAAEGHPPEVILARLDHLLTAVEPGATVTLCVVLIEFGSDTLHIANAGHLPPVLRGPDGTTSFVPEHGPLLGVGLPHPPARRIVAEPGTLVLLVTDGLIERRDEDLQHSLDTLARVVGEAPADPEGVCTHLLDRLVPDGGDDVALMAVRLHAVRPG
ncbi:fused response regulator/phosphatase [Streptomyces sp. SID161]|uniref:fused response regulator/phosphatase n=1 Tax=unclassified Streptomyces TaxID=2593676 RepID=UPI00136F6576|nr:fused response regulator/phosphatase [Streptomyces sp. SID161]MYW45530.1 SpoIIE family protein phosphatase [Streptomyces sp. SID161]